MQLTNSTDMKPLIVLTVSFAIAFCSIKILKKENDIALSARIAMSFMLVFTAIGHFAFTKGMALMIPTGIPFKESIIYLTAIFEILLAIGLHIPKLKITSAWILILFLCLMLPANIHAAIQKIDYQKATYNGPGMSYLWFRIPLQALFIIWTYLSSIRN